MRVLLTGLLFFLLGIPAISRSQTLSAENFFSQDTIPTLYLGIDFTQARLINDPESKANIIQERQFNGINELMLKEYKKYNFQKAFNRINWTVDISEVEKRNDAVNPDLLKSTNDSDLHRMFKPDLDTLVNGFNFGSHTGYGMLLIVEGMDKSKKIMTVWYTIIDMGKKEILFYKLLQGGVGGGFGFRNYWSSAIKNTINLIDNHEYNLWQQSFINK